MPCRNYSTITSEITNVVKQKQLNLSYIGIRPKGRLSFNLFNFFIYL